MKNITKYLILSLIVFSGCKNKSSDGFEKHQRIIKSELASGKYHSKLFLGLQFQDNEKEYNRKLDSLYKEGKLLVYRHKEGRDTITDVEYKFTDIADLNGIIFSVHPMKHNDSLKGIDLTAHPKVMWKSNYNSQQLIFDILLEEYSIKYGEPNYVEEPNNVYWIDGNLEINLELSKPESISGIDIEPYLSISYENTKKQQELLEKSYRNVYFVGRGTVDKWYQEELEKKKKPLNDI